MAKVFMPLLSASAQKSLAKALTFQHRKGKNLVRGYRTPTDRHSISQMNIRYWNSRGVLAWQGLSENEKELWRAYHDSAGRVGYYAFLSQYMKKKLSDQEIWRLPDGTILMAESTFSTDYTFNNGDTLGCRNSLTANILGESSIKSDSATQALIIDTTPEDTYNAYITSSKPLPSTFTIIQRFSSPTRLYQRFILLAAPYFSSVLPLLPISQPDAPAMFNAGILIMTTPAQFYFLFVAIAPGPTQNYYDGSSETWTENAYPAYVGSSSDTFTIKLQFTATDVNFFLYDSTMTLLVSATYPRASLQDPLAQQSICTGFPLIDKGNTILNTEYISFSE